MLLTITGASSIFIGAHTIKNVDHNKPSKLTGHGKTTVSSVGIFGKNTSVTNKSEPYIRISATQINPANMSLENLNQIASFNGVKEVYIILNATSNYGEILGIDPKKMTIPKNGNQFIDLQVIEGRLLTEEDNEKNIIIVNDLFAQGQKTTEGVAILGRLGYHSKSFMLGENEMNIVGIFSSIKSEKKRIIMPLSTLVNLSGKQIKLKKMETFVFLEESANLNALTQTIRNKVDTPNISMEIFTNTE
ncbi:hypothetical protein J7I91_21730 [Pseudomonas sp. ISL-84]|nr:hypothetical protein [Pseudomonas sp. ISL-84]